MKETLKRQEIFQPFAWPLGRGKFKPPNVAKYKQARDAFARFGAIPTGEWDGSHEVWYYINPRDNKVGIIHVIRHSSGEIVIDTIETQLKKMGLPKKVFWPVYYGEAPPKEWVAHPDLVLAEIAAAKEAKNKHPHKP